MPMVTIPCGSHPIEETDVGSFHRDGFICFISSLDFIRLFVVYLCVCNSTSGVCPGTANCNTENFSSRSGLPFRLARFADFEAHFTSRLAQVHRIMSDDQAPATPKPGEPVAVVEVTSSISGPLETEKEHILIKPNAIENVPETVAAAPVSEPSVETVLESPTRKHKKKSKGKENIETVQAVSDVTAVESASPRSETSASPPDSARGSPRPKLVCWLDEIKATDSAMISCTHSFFCSASFRLSCFVWIRSSLGRTRRDHFVAQGKRSTSTCWILHYFCCL
jgi:hypothetical protein